MDQNDTNELPFTDYIWTLNKTAVTDAYFAPRWSLSVTAWQRADALISRINYRCCRRKQKSGLTEGRPLCVYFRWSRTGSTWPWWWTVCFFGSLWSCAWWAPWAYFSSLSSRIPSLPFISPAQTCLVFDEQPGMCTWGLLSTVIVFPQLPHVCRQQQHISRSFPNQNTRLVHLQRMHRVR